METEWMNETSAEAPSVPAPEKTEKKKFSLKGFGGKKKKRWLKILIILVVVIAIVAGCVSRLTKNVNTQLSSSYLVSTVTRQDLTVSVSGTATLQPADSYNVTTLLSGDIVSAPFEEGDLVTKDTLLYTMDSSDAQDSMDRAQISRAAGPDVLSAGPGGPAPHGAHLRHGERDLRPQRRERHRWDAAGEDRGQHGAVHRLPVPLCLPQ